MIKEIEATLEERIKILEEKVNSLERIVINFSKKEDLDIIESNYNECFSDCYCKNNFDDFEFKATNKKVTLMDQISNYIETIIIERSDRGDAFVIISSGEIHKAMNLKSRIPSVCAAMIKVAKECDFVNGYEVVRDTPSHKSSTYTIKYKF